MRVMNAPASNLDKTPWPPGLTEVAYFHCPAPLRPDALQAAWAAYAQGLKPDTGVRQVVRHELKHRARKPNFDLCPANGIRQRF